jgi:hypothetical protein
MSTSLAASTPGPPDRIEFIILLLVGAAVVIFGHANAELLTAAAAALGSLMTVRNHRSGHGS